MTLIPPSSVIVTIVVRVILLVCQRSISWFGPLHPLGRPAHRISFASPNQRHGETSYNHSKTIQGHLDVPLNAQGVAQAAVAGRWLRANGQGFDEVWSSDLCRAKKTAEVVLEYLGERAEAVREDERLRERHLGKMQGKRRDECSASDASTIEPTSVFSGRLLSFWNDRFPSGSTNGASAAAPPRRLLITSHGGSIRQLLHSLLLDQSSYYSLQLPDEPQARLGEVVERRIGNCCFTELRMNRTDEGIWKGLVTKYADESHFDESSRAPSPGKNEDVVEDA